MSPLPLLATLVLPLLPSVSAHGFVHKVWLGSTNYVGNIPQAEPTASIVRQINTVDPVKGALNPYLNCGQDAQLAESVGTADPGDALGFLWQGGDLSRWPHNTGPMLTYMTNCGGDCATFNSSAAKWFKIAQVGRDANGDWIQARIYAADNVYANATLPATIAPGNYLIRHEIIALHLATEMGGAEFYPSCSQVTVGGSGTGAPTASELVELPGAYSDDDPGIYVPDVYDTPAPPYTFPGPPIAAFVGGAGSTSGGGSATATSSGSTHTPPSPPTAPGKTCKLKRVPVPSATASASPTKREAVMIKRHAHTFSARHILSDLALTFRSPKQAH